MTKQRNAALLEAILTLTAKQDEGLLKFQAPTEGLPKPTLKDRPRTKTPLSEIQQKRRNKAKITKQSRKKNR